MFDAVLKEANIDVVATDFDATRRRFFNSRMKIIKDNEIKSSLKKLSLFDLKFIDGYKALYFDDKHNSKRIRSVVISDTRGCKVGRSVLANDQLKYVMNKVGVKNTSSMLNPLDKPNVPFVLRLYKSLEECVVHSSNCADDTISRKLKNVLQVLYHIFDGELCIFADPEISLATQLKKLSKLSHILLAEYRSSALLSYLGSYNMTFSVWAKDVFMLLFCKRETGEEECICTKSEQTNWRSSSVLLER